MLVKSVLYRADATATAGRDTQVVSPEGALDLKVTMPPDLGGTNGRGTNPEQLFAATYAASFLGMLRLVSAGEGLSLPGNTQVEASVGVGAIARGFGIEVELRIQLPGMARVEVDALVMRAHELCPYSNATRNNVSVRLVIT
ncbi:MAG: organic hydroperoxide resistance protein [Gammaproteobacteria bacterium]